MANERIATLVPDQFASTLTRLDDGAMKSRKPTKTGAIVASPFNGSLNANQNILVAAANKNRKALLIQNLDATANLYIGFGIFADVNGFFLGAKGIMLLDVVCPTDAVYLLATANIQFFFGEMSQTA